MLSSILFHGLGNQKIKMWIWHLIWSLIWSSTSKTRLFFYWGIKKISPPKKICLCSSVLEYWKQEVQRLATHIHTISILLEIKVPQRRWKLKTVLLALKDVFCIQFQQLWLWKTKESISEKLFPIKV